MFTWICPKCKSEVPPSYSECPNCAANAAAPPTPADPQPTVPQVVQESSSAPPPVHQPEPPPRVSPYAVEPPRPTGGVPSWLVAVGSMIGIAALLAILYLWVLPSRRNAPAIASSADRPAGTAVPLNAHPMAKHLEISGIRLTEDQRQRAHIQFVVTNHSGADLPELKMEIGLISSGNKPSFDFPFTLPSLGPYESKDFSMLVKTQLRVYELPDWQFLHAEFKIISSQ